MEFKGGLAGWRLRLIDERVQQIGRAPTIAELSELCKISPRQLQRGFRVSRGCSIGHHIEHCRIENAKRLLQRGEAIGNVATALGYASQSSFSFAFRRATGSTPLQFGQLV
jgi:AraC family transcriptional regulator